MASKIYVSALTRQGRSGGSGGAGEGYAVVSCRGSICHGRDLCCKLKRRSIVGIGLPSFWCDILMFKAAFIGVHDRNSNIRFGNSKGL